MPGSHYAGEVSYVYPWLDDMTRTGRVRIVLPNADLAMRPGMFADVTFRADLGEAVQVPESAVIFTGPRHIVFVDLGEGRLQPRDIEVGLRAGGVYQVVSGLEVGERIVTSGNFLVAAESRIRSATTFWSARRESE